MMSSPCHFSAASQDVKLEELPTFVGPFRKIRTIRESPTGKTYLVEPEIPEGKPLTVKKIPKNVAAHGGANEILAALAVQELACDTIIRCHGATQDEKFYYLTMEYCQQGGLCSVLQRFGRHFDEATLRRFALQLLTSVKKLHDHGVCHRNISLESVLVCEDGSLRLSDFSQAMRLPAPDAQNSQEAMIENGQALLPNKDGYRAPEIYRGQAYNGKSIDAFACGVIIYALAIGSQGTLKYPIERYLPRYLFSGDFSNLTAHLESLGVRVSVGLTLFLEALLEPNAAHRSTLEKALSHPWMINSEAPKDSKDVKAVNGTSCKNENTCPNMVDDIYTPLIGG
jgi:serine/threonine protein kinase